LFVVIENCFDTELFAWILNVHPAHLPLEDSFSEIHDAQKHQTSSIFVASRRSSQFTVHNPHMTYDTSTIIDSGSENGGTIGADRLQAMQMASVPFGERID
jgi:folate-dependent phosphoribosylglycinamide formyltransferase PurN